MEKRFLNAIAAVYSDWGIGENGTQPVVIREDRRHFRQVTDGAAVIVGRKTLSDFPGGRPLKGRTNIVLSGSSLAVEGAEVVHSLDEAIAAAQRCEKVFVIGGESVYRQFLPYIRQIYITKINAHPHCDAFFPDLDKDGHWHITEDSGELDQDGIKYRFMVYRHE